MLVNDSDSFEGEFYEFNLEFILLNWILFNLDIEES